MTGSVSCPNCGHALLSIQMEHHESVLAARPCTDPEIPVLLRIPDAARLLDVSRSTVYQLIASEQLPVVRIGRSVRVV